MGSGAAKADMPEAPGESLDLSKSDLSKLPEEQILGFAEILKRLYLHDNRLTCKPPRQTSFQDMHERSGSLQRLGSFTATNLMSASATIVALSHSTNWACLKALTNLEQLTLQGNQLESIPVEVCSLPKLNTLTIGNNQLSTLPHEAAMMTALEKLALNNNLLGASPLSVGLDSLTNMANLTSLDLVGNGLKEANIPAGLSGLRYLHTLDLSVNAFTTFPLVLTRLPALTSLTMSSNQLTSIPPEIGRLSQLRMLDLSSNALTEVPPTLGELHSLTVLRLGFNQLTSLPLECVHMIALRELSLRWNQLEEVPKFITAAPLTNLVELDLWTNRIAKLPSNMEVLCNLALLNVSSNELSRLPRSLGRLVSLTKLDVAYNQLSVLPPELGRLPKLRELNASHNPIEDPEIEPLMKDTKSSTELLLEVLRTRAEAQRATASAEDSSAGISAESATAENTAVKTHSPSTNAAVPRRRLSDTTNAHLKLSEKTQNAAGYQILRSPATPARATATKREHSPAQTRTTQMSTSPIAPSRGREKRNHGNASTAASPSLAKHQQTQKDPKSRPATTPLTSSGGRSGAASAALASITLSAAELQDEEKVVEKLGLECPICQDLLYEPIVTSCSHSFCRPCLSDMVSYERQCPVCKSTLDLTEITKPVNERLLALLKEKVPNSYRRREAAEYQLSLERKMRISRPR